MNRHPILRRMLTGWGPWALSIQVKTFGGRPLRPPFSHIDSQRFPFKWIANMVAEEVASEFHRRIVDAIVSVVRAP